MRGDPPLNECLGSPGGVSEHDSHELQVDFFEYGYSNMEDIVDYCFAMLDIDPNTQKNNALTAYNGDSLKEFIKTTMLDKMRSELRRTYTDVFGERTVEYLILKKKTYLIQNALCVIGLLKGFQPVPLESRIGYD